MDWLNKIFTKNKNLAWRIIDKETVIIALGNQSEKGEKLNIFNETATMIWELIDGKNSVKDIIRNIVDEYDIEPERAQFQIKELMSKMVSKNLIKI